MTPVPGSVFHVQPQQARHTLAALLRGWLPGKSWSEIQRLIRARHVLVNGNLCLDAGRRLSAQEVVKVLEHPTAPLPKLDDVKVRYLDADLIVVEKPSGMTSNRHAEERNWSARRKQLQSTLDELLPRVIDKLQRPYRTQGSRSGRAPKGPPPPVRPVHRLDRETSGLMVFARTKAAERHLGQQFRQHTTHRKYLAVVHGHVAAQTITSHLVRDRGDGRRGSTSDPHLGKQAVTHIQPIEQFEEYTLIECRLETGRTHQIRIHLAELGHPLCGEKVYHQPLFGTPRTDRSGAPRIALHAAELGFSHPTAGKPMQFSMPLPDDLAAFIARLRAKRT